VQLVLEVDERVVRRNVELNVAQDAGNDTRSDLLGLRLHVHLEKLVLRDAVLDSNDGARSKSNVGLESGSDSLNAKQIISVCRNFNLDDLFFRDIDSLTLVRHSVHHHLFGSTEFNFDSVLEAQVLKLLVS
jgi:hypothetical protein